MLQAFLVTSRNFLEQHSETFRLAKVFAMVCSCALSFASSGLSGAIPGFGLCVGRHNVFDDGGGANRSDKDRVGIQAEVCRSAEKSLRTPLARPRLHLTLTVVA